MANLTSARCILAFLKRKAATRLAHSARLLLAIVQDETSTDPQSSLSPSTLQMDSLTLASDTVSIMFLFWVRKSYSRGYKMPINRITALWHNTRQCQREWWIDAHCFTNDSHHEWQIRRRQCGNLAVRLERRSHLSLQLRHHIRSFEEVVKDCAHGSTGGIASRDPVTDKHTSPQL
jgi:hypothetical protein